MDISVIIPTYNRSEDLKKVFKSLFIQSVKPKEVIIVDDSDNDIIKELCIEMTVQLKKENIALNYIHNKNDRSLTIARNIGIRYATSDIILFLDDDVELDTYYISEILKVYKEYPMALGVQGIITNMSVKSGTFLDKLLFNFHTEENKCRVLPTACNTYPYGVKDIISCEWLSGANQSYKKEILQRFKFDEKMKKYCYKEDIDLSYRIHKSYPNSLFITPHAKLIHHISKEERLPNRDITFMKQVYTFYFFFKNIDKNIGNVIMFVFGTTGSFIRYFIKYSVFLILRPSEYKLLRLKYHIYSFIYCLAHLRNLKNLELEFFNKTLK